ncbi:UrcA family protein [Mangrovimicrobium sediminis]|uniref:UrcA family protein n=1 Tax=Mangrovimicrobium sediminis TaxID=2562682 RepID=A0A4Z0M042_9GAMM|nr:UrcA family protein [Haliea sp. SAOS-164]TGD72806.1 UrcA family protein [Haliea sp. SAOS-164]
MNKIAKSMLTAAAITLTGAFALNASAETMDQTLVRAPAVPSTAVSFTRSELATEEGLAAVEARIQRAADRVCGVTTYREAGSVEVFAEQKACADEAVASAMTRIGAAQVASID